MGGDLLQRTFNVGGNQETDEEISVAIPPAFARWELRLQHALS